MPGLTGGLGHGDTREWRLLSASASSLPSRALPSSCALRLDWSATRRLLARSQLADDVVGDPPDAADPVDKRRPQGADPFRYGRPRNANPVGHPSPSDADDVRDPHQRIAGPITRPPSATFGVALFCCRRAFAVTLFGLLRAFLASALESAGAFGKCLLLVGQAADDAGLGHRAQRERALAGRERRSGHEIQDPRRQLLRALVVNRVPRFEQEQRRAGGGSR